MTGRQRLVASVVVSALGHIALARTRGLLTGTQRGLPPSPTETLDVEVLEAEPPRPPEYGPPVADAMPSREPASGHAARSTREAVHARREAERAAIDPGPADSSSPAFSVSMESTSQAGGGSSGSGRGAGGGAGAGAGRGSGGQRGPALEAYAATAMPLPRGRCSGRYTEDARRAGIEGTVLLDLVVGEDGRARDIRVVQGLPHGLSAAAVTALRDCRFTPGERDRVPVAVRVRAFKIRFFLQEGD